MRDVIPVTRSVMPSLEEYTAEIASVWDNRWLTNQGEKHRELEARLCERMGVEKVVLFTNGHLALETAIRSQKLTGEVITTPFTFASTTQAIVQNGLTPVFCDISPEDYTMDPAKIEALITPRTCAIVPVHVYGNICDVEAIGAIAKKHGLKVIYDAAHAFGEKKNGVDVGNFGDLSMFSFHATKVFHTIEGGCATCHDEKTYQLLSALKNFGEYSAEDVDEVGGNAKMTEFQAAMGLCNLRHLAETIAMRKRAAERYRERLDGVSGLRLNPIDAAVESNYAYFPVLVDAKRFGVDRDELQKRLAEKQILTRKYFYPATNRFQAYQGLFELQETPIAQRVSEQVLALPLYAELSTETVDEICDAILEEKR